MVARAARLGLDAVAITDHDTIAGVEEALATGSLHELEVVPAVEVSVGHGNGEIHMLAYYPDVTPELEKTLARYREARAERIGRIITRLEEVGVDTAGMSAELAGPDRALGRPHVARSLVRRGVAGSVRQAFERYLGRGGVAYVDRERPSLAEVLEWMSACSAVPVLAHPGRLATGLIRELACLGLQGIEAYHPDHDVGTQARLVAIAGELGLIVTGGSDFHGPEHARYSELGRFRVGNDVVSQLRRRHEHQR